MTQPPASSPLPPEPANEFVEDARSAVAGLTVGSAAPFEMAVRKLREGLTDRDIENLRGTMKNIADDRDTIEGLVRNLSVLKRVLAVLA